MKYDKEQIRKLVAEFMADDYLHVNNQFSVEELEAVHDETCEAVEYVLNKLPQS